MDSSRVHSSAPAETFALDIYEPKTRKTKIKLDVSDEKKEDDTNVGHPRQIST